MPLSIVFLLIAGTRIQATALDAKALVAGNPKDITKDIKKFQYKIKKEKREAERKAPNALDQLTEIFGPFDNLLEKVKEAVEGDGENKENIQGNLKDLIRKGEDLLQVMAKMMESVTSYKQTVSTLPIKVEDKNLDYLSQIRASATHTTLITAKNIKKLRMALPRIRSMANKVSYTQKKLKDKSKRVFRKFDRFVDRSTKKGEKMKEKLHKGLEKAAVRLTDIQERIDTYRQAFDTSDKTALTLLDAGLKAVGPTMTRKPFYDSITGFDKQQVLAKEAGKDKMEKYAEQVDRAFTRRTSGLKEREKEKETGLANSVHSIISGDMDKTSAVIDAMVSFGDKADEAKNLHAKTWKNVKKREMDHLVRFREALRQVLASLTELQQKSRDTREKREPAYRGQIDEQVQSTTGMIQKLNKDMATVIEHQIGSMGMVGLETERELKEKIFPVNNMVSITQEAAMATEGRVGGFDAYLKTRKQNAWKGVADHEKLIAKMGEQLDAELLRAKADLALGDQNIAAEAVERLKALEVVLSRRISAVAPAIETPLAKSLRNTQLIYEKARASMVEKIQMLRDDLKTVRVLLRRNPGAEDKFATVAVVQFVEAATAQEASVMRTAKQLKAEVKEFEEFYKGRINSFVKMDSSKLMEENSLMGAAVKGSISSRVKRYLRKANDISKRTMNSRKAQEDIAMDLSKGQEFSGALAQNLADATDEEKNNFALTDQQMKELIEDLDHQIAGVNPASESALEVLRSDMEELMAEAVETVSDRWGITTERASSKLQKAGEVSETDLNSRAQEGALIFSDFDALKRKLGVEENRVPALIVRTASLKSNITQRKSEYIQVLEDAMQEMKVLARKYRSDHQGLVDKLGHVANVQHDNIQKDLAYKDLMVKSAAKRAQAAEREKVLDFEKNQGAAAVDRNSVFAALKKGTGGIGGDIARVEKEGDAAIESATKSSDLTNSAADQGATALQRKSSGDEEEESETIETEAESEAATGNRGDEVLSTLVENSEASSSKSEAMETVFADEAASEVKQAAVNTAVFTSKFASVSDSASDILGDNVGELVENEKTLAKAIQAVETHLEDYRKNDATNTSAFGMLVNDLNKNLESETEFIDQFERMTQSSVLHLASTENKLLEGALLGIHEKFEDLDKMEDRFKKNVAKMESNDNFKAAKIIQNAEVDAERAMRGTQVAKLQLSLFAEKSEKWMDKVLKALVGDLDLVEVKDKLMKGLMSEEKGTEEAAVNNTLVGLENDLSADETGKEVANLGEVSSGALDYAAALMMSSGSAEAATVNGMVHAVEEQRQTATERLEEARRKMAILENNLENDTEYKSLAEDEGTIDESEKRAAEVQNPASSPAEMQQRLLEGLSSLSDGGELNTPSPETAAMFGGEGPPTAFVEVGGSPSDSLSQRMRPLRQPPAPPLPHDLLVSPPQMTPERSSLTAFMTTGRAQIHLNEDLRQEQERLGLEVDEALATWEQHLRSENLTDTGQFAEQALQQSTQAPAAPPFARQVTLPEVQLPEVMAWKLHVPREHRVQLGGGAEKPTATH